MRNPLKNNKGFSYVLTCVCILVVMIHEAATLSEVTDPQKSRPNPSEEPPMTAQELRLQQRIVTTVTIPPMNMVLTPKLPSMRDIAALSISIILIAPLVLL